ncbi:DUF1559 family PulG-like putative transporter [Lignipirellula cremea]|uniref:DUF1559 domain-containing protein n=1 Tax=Lignipirellula cremea TaxID=2528010 RepID=A0A518DU28_9BACT|nr:DUF1559 domain-containing protein [Lignipirellula cremea]QDU95336.1 hypothetical protein Pla8534_31510 [Lignipirellula cremea]
MAIEFTCPKCQHRTSESDEYAGSSCLCANCGETVMLSGAPGDRSSSRRDPVVGGPLVQTSGGKSRARWVLAGLGVCGALAALLLPAFLAACSHVRKAECRHQLSKIGYALAAYQEVHGSFPPAYITDENGKPMHSWRVLLLPYLGQHELYARYDFNESWDSSNNYQVGEQCPAEFHCPSDPSDKKISRYQVVVGPGTGWKANEGVRIEEITDGTSQTIAVLEVQTGRNWLDPTPLTLDDVLPPLEQTRGQSASRFETHPGGGQAVFFDGSVHIIFSDLKPETLRRLLRINDGVVVDRQEF